MKRLGSRHALLIVGALLLPACEASPQPTASPQLTPSPAVTVSAEVAADVDRLVEALDEIHPNAWHGVSRDEWIAAKDDLLARLPSLTPEAATVEMMRLVALLSREGRDGHQFAIPQEGSEGRFLPFRVYAFEEGLTVTAAMAPNEDLVGARITAIGSAPIEDVLAAVEPLVPRDGPATVPSFLPIFLIREQVLAGLGIVPAGSDSIDLTVVDTAGSRSVALPLVAASAWWAWAGTGPMHRLPHRSTVRYLVERDAAWEMEYVEASRALYLRCTDIRSVPSGLTGAFRDRAAQPDVDRVVVDLRQNPGGDNHEYPPMLSILEEWSAAHPGRLFVITDRVTFSAASNFATELEQRTDATFIGEAMGGGLNFWDDVTWIDLDALPIPMRVGVSTRYWEMSVPDDPRLTIEPDIAVPVTAEDYFDDLDPALVIALTAPPVD